MESHPELEAQIDRWRGYVQRSQAISPADVDELEDHLREHIADRQATGLDGLSLSSTSVNGFSLSLQSTPTAVQLVVAPVPEPTGIGLVALGIFGLNRLNHRRRSRLASR